MIEDSSISAGLSVVELVDDDDLKGIRRDVLDAVRGERLHAGKDVLPPLRSGAADVQLAEGTVCQNLAVGPQRLLQDFAAMGDKQQAWSPAVDTERAVVQGRDDGL